MINPQNTVITINSDLHALPPPPPPICKKSFTSFTSACYTPPHTRTDIHTHTHTHTHARTHTHTRAHTHTHTHRHTSLSFMINTPHGDYFWLMTGSYLCTLNEHVWISGLKSSLTLKVPEKLQLYGLCVYCVVQDLRKHVGMLIMYTLKGSFSSG